MKHFLLWKLLILQLLIVVVVVVIVNYAVRDLSAAHFMTLIDKYDVPEEAAYGMFLESIRRYLLYAGLAGGSLAMAISFVVTRQILRPLTQLASAAEKIAGGDFSAKVSVPKRGEFARVTATFNQMAESLRRTDDLRKSLVRNVAHELRTPLTNIRGYLEALRDKVVSPSAATFQMLHEESLRLVHLVDDLVRLARADAALAELATEEVCLEKMVHQTLKLFLVRFKAKKIRVKGNLGLLREPVLADRRKLAQIMTNLVDNSCRYTPEGGVVEVRGERSHQSLKLIFSNASEPINEEERSLLFERFYRREKSRSRASGGAGIGLAIVKQLVESHGGEVGTEYRNSTFSVWFSIPLQEARDGLRLSVATA